MNTDEQAKMNWISHEGAPRQYLVRHDSVMGHLRSSVFICGFIAFAFALALPAYAEVTAKDAWVRATVPAQKTTAAYVTLQSTDYARIVEVKTPVAGHAEIHNSEMVGGVMKMDAMDDFLLLPGKTVELKPGGYHLMLMELPKPLAAGGKVPLTFVVEDRKGKRSNVEVSAEVRPIGR
jgi:copper(I)-binding protein